jgi:hypothetical protein
VICSANSDAVLASSQPSPGGVLDVVVQCPVGQRAIGGGVGKNTDDVIPRRRQRGPHARDVRLEGQEEEAEAAAVRVHRRVPRATTIGKHAVMWSVGGKKITAWTFRVVA